MSQATIKSFFKSPHFAVVGATPDPNKYGHKVFAWYLSHSLPVTGINPRTPTVLTHETLASLKDLENPEETSVSFITPPQVTRATLEVAADIKIPAVWFQPGAYDGDCVRFAKEKGMVVVARGKCVLVDGGVGVEARGKL
ncbi:CoA-binding protein [Tuber indicum]|nr:CoA-binding protein [Tuber indicum]